MNSFGRIFRINIFGESHGELVGILIDGCPPGLTITQEDFLPDLSRRRGGARGTTSREETDIPFIKSGVFNTKTTGAPVSIIFHNKDINSKDYEKIMDTPRPGHADMVARQKFRDFNDYRGGGHFSGRLTVGLVAAGVIAKKLLAPVQIEARVIEAGGSKDIRKSVESAVEEGDSIGGIIECNTKGLPAGLGEPFFDSVESLLSHMVFSIPGIKGIEFGTGFSCSEMRGSSYNDEILTVNGRTRTNHSGGINGGITSGNDMFFRVAVRPAASIKKPQMTVNLKTGLTEEISIGGRHDACIALRVPVILEAVAAIVLVDLMFIKQAVSSQQSAVSSQRSAVSGQQSDFIQK